MTPIEAYQSDINLRGFQVDQSQQDAVAKTQRLYDKLITPTIKKKKQTLLTLFSKKTTPPIKGLYFWGGVGRGKSYLLDTFYDCLPIPDKKRVHFNQFMQDIHNQLKNLPKTPDPLVMVSSTIAEKCRVLCIDEFHVDDITDAMILGGLLDSLFNFGVTLVTSSNIAPVELYKNGLQRDRFLPAIGLIETHTEVFKLDNNVDYRLKMLEKNGTYHVQTTDSPEGDKLLNQHLSDLANTKIINNIQIELNSRKINCRARADNQIWFDFTAICETPRSSRDYVALAKKFETVLISNIPTMDDNHNDVVQRFIQLVDAIYDHRTKFIVTAQTSPDSLYTGQGLQFPFQRTASRLHEMRSEIYLSLPHIS